MKSIFSVILVMFVSTVFSQNLDYRGEYVRGMIIKQSNEIKGNDFIYNEWNLGMLVLNDSVFSKQDHLKYDAFNDR
ncbi:hypothetical protein, partial [uncultured Lutibacter sp.]|uniref:hypothetical protein n=1 Tax=uncultured Lutibacter sp. TaxID=437739 RepID=UPI0026049C14